MKIEILLTGGAGFIGSATLVALLKQGRRVTVVDCFEPTLYAAERKLENLAWARTFGTFDFHEVDIRNTAAMNAILDAKPFDAVVHLAAVAGVRPSIDNAPLYYDINVTATSAMLEHARTRGIDHFVHASSSSVYGANTKVPFSELDPVEHPVSPYAASKRALELLVQTHHHLHGGNHACLRFFTVYGPRQRPEMAIHKFMELIAHERPVPMFGDGSTARDYTYIDDIVAGVLAALDRIQGYRVWNLGGDRVVRLDELVRTLGDVVGKTPILQHLPMQPGDVLLTNADLTRARAELDYSPSTPLEQGLSQMWQWYQNRQKTM